MITAKNVYKSFGDVKALRGVSVDIAEGKIYSLLGPNGAGKTTLVRVIATLLEPDKGEVTVNGFNVTKDAQRVREQIGLAGQFAAVDDFLTGRETLEMVARLYRVPRLEAKKRTQEILERMGLTEAANRPARTYSGGMRRRLDLGASLVGKPDVLLLDEPTTGLDPRTRQELWELIRELTEEGRTILLTTQYLEEADALSNYISIIDHGKVVQAGTSAQLKASLGADVVELHVEAKDQAKAVAIVKRVAHTEPAIDEITQSISVRTSKAADLLLIITENLRQEKIKPTDLSLHRPSLDDVFLAVTGKKASSGRKK